MFSKLYNWYLAEDRPSFFFFLCFLFPLAMIAMITIFRGAEKNSDGCVEALSATGQISLTIWLSYIGISTIAPLLDTILKSVVSYITHGDNEKFMPIGKTIFGQPYVDGEVLHWHRMSMRTQHCGHRMGAFYMFLGLLAAVLTLMITFTNTLPYVIGGLLFIGVAWGGIGLAHYAYGLSKKLQEHKEDPDAHKVN